MDLQLSKSLDRQVSFRILIIGEVGAGKTRLTEKLLRTLVSLGLGEMVTVVDLAPSYKGVGLPLNINGVKVLRPKKIYAPRLMGRSCSEVWEYAKRNAEFIEPLLKEYIANPTPVLVINDLTIYLHAGNPDILYEAINKSILFIGNAYYGVRLKDRCGLWERERKLVDELSSKVDAVWCL